QASASPLHQQHHPSGPAPPLRRRPPPHAVLCPSPTPADAAARSDVEVATLAPNGSPPITRTIFPTCRAHYPGGSSGCACRLLPLTRPSPNGRRVGIRIVTFEACLGFTHVTAHRIAQPPTGNLLSRGSDPCGYPHKPLASYRINRQLSVWNLPPLMIRAFGAHCQLRTCHRMMAMCEKRHGTRGDIGSCLI